MGGGVRQAYTLQQVAERLQVPRDTVRELAELVHGQPRDLFTSRDLVLLRHARNLMQRKLPRARAAAALLKARELPGAAVHPEGRELVVSSGTRRWNAESGQQLLDLDAPSRTPWLRPMQTHSPDAEQLFDAAVELEEAEPASAADAYGEALAADPMHADAHVNLGRLLHQRGRLREAEAHYVAALVSRPDDITATFNLAVVLEDQGRADEAIARYSEAIALDPHCVDAYFNLSRLCEKKGQKMAALRHLKDYRRLSRQG